jgi:uncharacterized cupin superfamily protein
MKRVNENDLPWIERRSPKGKYHRFRRSVSQALAADAAGAPLPARPPFEVDLVRLPRGAANYPLHSHSTEWEGYCVVSGTGVMHTNEGETKLAPGDWLLCPPWDAHQIVNDGEADLVYYVIADNAAYDIWHYPNSDKWGIALPNGEDVYFRKSDVDYYDREE